uniref:ABC transporter F family member 4-like n=1 Tax=Cyprinodon variegatus TaxID=28743 RepID=A0A3Q2DR22_CYPVA
MGRKISKKRMKTKFQMRKWRARYCPGIVTDGKCHQFFRERKTFEDAEFFCQEQFSGGHLASITSQHLHQQLMSLVQQNSGYTRTWVGGLRIEVCITQSGNNISYLISVKMQVIEVFLSMQQVNMYCVDADKPFICSYPTQ